MSDKQSLTDLQNIVADTLASVCAMADKHNIDRNSLLKCFADTITTFAEMASIQNYEANRSTNADRIRSMTDEELAEFITGSSEFDCADYCDSFAQGCAFKCGKKEREIALKWLQSEADRKRIFHSL